MTEARQATQAQARRGFIGFCILGLVAGLAFASAGNDQQHAEAGHQHRSHHGCFGQRATDGGTSGPDVILGSAGDDVIVLRSGNDSTFGLSGRDRLCGGAGDDDLVGGPGFDRLNGGPGVDRCSGELERRCEE